MAHEFREWRTHTPEDELTAFDLTQRHRNLCGFCSLPKAALIHGNQDDGTPYAAKGSDVRAAIERLEGSAVQTTQVGGDHYVKHQIQPWHIIDEYNLSFYEGNVVKYLLRQKGDRLTDLKKARHYLDKQIELEGG